MKEVATAIKRKKPVTLEEIQKDLLEASEEAFGKAKEAEELVKVTKKENKEIFTKAKRLTELGFTAAPSVKRKKKVNRVIKEIRDSAPEASKEIEKLRKAYSEQFPGYVFVPTKAYEKIMERYDLYKSTPDRYIREVPEKNLKEIEKFAASDVFKWKVTEETAQSRWMFSAEGTWARFNRKTKDSFDQVGDAFRQSFFTKKIVASGLSEEEAMKEAERLVDIYNSALTDSSLHRVFKDPAAVRAEKEKPELEITAPVSHFNLDNTEIKGRTIRKIEVRDPIVTHKVEGGFIIITAWDKEALIPGIVDPRKN